MKEIATVFLIPVSFQGIPIIENNPSSAGWLHYSSPLLSQMITITPPGTLKRCLVSGVLNIISRVLGELFELRVGVDITHPSLHEGPKTRMTPSCFWESSKDAELAISTWGGGGGAEVSLRTVPLVSEHPSHFKVLPVKLTGFIKPMPPKKRTPA